MFSIPQVFAAAAPSSVQLKGAPTTPNRVSPTAGTTSHTRLYHRAPQGTAPAGPPQTIMRNMTMPMKAASVPLQAGQATRFVGSDGRLELQIPAGAVTTQDLATAGGALTLHVTQIAPASGAVAGGSGHLSFGMYLLQVADAHGALFPQGLRLPVIALYHFHPNEVGLGLDRAYVTLNGSLSAGVPTLQGIVQPARGQALERTLGSLSIIQTHLDMQAQTLAVTTMVAAASTSISWNSDAPIATFGKPDPFSTDLSGGGLTSSLPIDLPAGPGGLTPPVNLTYSSESVNEQHSYAASAGWVGEGWNLSVGEITWNQHNVTANCQSSSCSGPDWQNQWFLNDAYGTSSELIPPDITASTFYDASPNVYCALPNPTMNCPILWHTASESHAKIYAYVGSINIGQTVNGQPLDPPCWRVWLPNGIMEEFGCTNDSVQYFPVIGGHAEVSAWKLDLITDPQGNQIHFTYQSDMATWVDPTTNKSYTYPRDIALHTIEYDSPGCHNAQSMCTGSAWAPQMQVVFNASHSPNFLTGSAPTGCNTGSNLRCDNPVDLSSSLGLPAPMVQNTFVLNSVWVQVRTSGSASWNILRNYELGYAQSGPMAISDDTSGISASSAGLLDLTRFQEAGAGGANAIMYSGFDKSSTSPSFAYMKVFDVSSQNIVVGPNTTLSYWIYPQSQAGNAAVSGQNSTCVAIDMIFSDGSDLRDSGAVDQNGNQLHPAHQCGHLTLDQWNLVTSDIGSKVGGKTINRIDIGYDQPPNTGGYRGYVDDLLLSNPGSSTPLFTSDLESGSPQPTWTNTVDTGGGNIANVGGICCNLPGPELGARQEQFHTDSAAQAFYSFTYTHQDTFYVDSFFHPTPATACGFPWNTGNGSGCLLWETNYNGNNQYLTTMSNDQGLAESFTWAQASSNTHGVPGGGSNTADPFYCEGHPDGYPCNESDDSAWSHMVLSQESSTTIRLTQNGQGGTQTPTQVTETTGYSYQLTTPLPAQQCSDCVAGMYWGDQNNANYLNYYDGIFMGFAQTTVAHPDGSVDVHKFYAGQGWGIYDTGQVGCFTKAACHNDPWWNLANAGHGREYQDLSYDVDGTTLLKEVDTSSQAICPPSGVAGTPASSQFGNWDGHLVSILDHNNPVVACDIQQTQQVSKTFVGSSNSVSTNTSWTYDSFGRQIRQTSTGARLEAEGLQVVSSTAPVSVQGNCCGVTWSGNAQLFFNNTAANNSFTLNVSVAIAGAYQLAAAFTQAPDYGIASLAVDGTAVGQPFDAYNSSVSLSAPISEGPLTLSGGTHTLTLTVTGKNSASSNYRAGLDYLLLSSAVNPAAVVTNTGYIWNDNVSATRTSASGTYIINTPAFADTEDSLGNRLQCSYTSYDGHGYTTGQTGNLTGGLATTKTGYSDCGNASNNYTPSGPSTITTTYDTYGNAIGTTDADANGGVSGHTGCTLGSTSYTTCTTYDNTFQVFATATQNALNQGSSANYSNTGALFGFGTWPVSTTDVNGQTTSYTYDALGRKTGEVDPGESSGNLTTQSVYTDWCNGTAAQAPCVEIDQVSRLNSTTTVTSRAFYDGEGRLVETRTPGPVGQGQDVVTYAYYDNAGRMFVKSNPYFVTAYTGLPGAGAYSIPDSTQPGTSTTYIDLQKTSVTDPNSFTTTTTASLLCGVPGTRDTGCYVQSMVVDANGHQSATITGWLGKTNYTQTYTGASASSYALYATTSHTYDAAGHLLSTISPDGTTASAIYDDLGRITSSTDPDRGTTGYTYDPNGNPTEEVDARGSAGTIFAGYDGLNRVLWHNATNTPSGAWVTYSYDSTAGGNVGVGRLTGESFSGSGSLTGSYAYTYDTRGRQTGQTITVNGTGYPLQAAYNDAGQVTTQTYPTGEVVTNNYDNNGWLNSLTTTLSGVITTLAANLSYAGLAGAAGKVTSMSLANNIYTYNAAYDTGMRLSSKSLSTTSGNTLLYQTQPLYSAHNDVVSVQTSIGGQTDNQQFCYDDLNRLTWAGAKGIPPCASLTPGTLTAAQYQQSYTYDVEGRLTAGPDGTNTYGDPTHPHALTATSTSYGATYDATGNEVCRAPSSAKSCSGSTITGELLTYDAEGRLATWQNKPKSPGQTMAYLYDGSGTRVATLKTVSGTTTLTAYIGNAEEVQTSGSTTQTTTYYLLGGTRLAANVNGTMYYFGYDALGSQVVVLDKSGNILGSQLYGPYGSSRYSTGTLPTSIGFTGQRADSLTGLDYYGARYYDPVVGQFLSADVKEGNLQGMDPYGYVAGDPETLTDPTGQRYVNNGDECPPGQHVAGGACAPNPGGGSGSGGGGSNPTPPPGGGCTWKGNPCSRTNNPCLSGTVWNGSGCVANTNGAAEGVRNSRLSALHTKADWELLAGYALFLVGDALSFFKGDTLEKLEAILDFFTTLANSILPLVGDLIGGTVYQLMSNISAGIMWGLGLVRGAIAVIRSGNWFLRNWADTVATLVADGMEGPGAIMTSVVLQAIKPVVGGLLDAGGHFLQGLGFADLAEETRQRNMSIQDWCVQYGGCPAGGS